MSSNLQLYECENQIVLEKEPAGRLLSQHHSPCAPAATTPTCQTRWCRPSSERHGPLLVAPLSGLHAPSPHREDTAQTLPFPTKLSWDMCPGVPITEDP